MEDNEKLTMQVLNLLYAAESCEYDLLAGTVTGTNERVIYLSSDLITGIHEALNYEAGEAWGLIFANCGYLWGKYEAKRLKKAVQVQIQQEVEQLSVDDFIALIEAYFSKQGWGKAKIHLDDAAQYGIIRVSLQNGLFDSTLGHLEGRVNYMVAGLLRAFFEYMSQSPLDCIETSWERSGEQNEAEFLISGADRIIQLQEQLGDISVNVNDALGRLRVM